MSPPNLQFPFEADAAMRRGSKLEAVKITREKLGLSLKDAKELCDAWSENDPVPAGATAVAPAAAPVPALGELPAACLDALRAGHKIEAIRQYREATGQGLKEAKEAVETYEAAHPELFPAPACDTGGCGAGRLLVALFALGLIAAALYFSGVLQ